MSLKTATNSAFDFQPGTGFDFAYSNRDVITFAASGLETSVRISTRGDLFTLVSRIGEHETELSAGSYEEIGDRLELIRARVFPKKPKPFVITLPVVFSLLAALTTASLCATFIGFQAANRPPVEPASTSQQVSQEEIQNLREFLTSQVNAGKLLSATSATQAKPVDGTPVTDGNNMLGVPSYQTKLYEDVQTPPPANAEPDQVAKPPKAPVAPTPTVKDVTDVSALRDKVTESLKGSNLTKAQAERALNEISMLTPQQLQGASLESLPSEVRQMLLDQMQTDTGKKGATETKDNVQDSVPTKLIMLPEQVIDRYRGHDGISSLPENSSWQARGNPTVQIQLPGGGDISSVEDLKAFGVHP